MTKATRTLPVLLAVALAGCGGGGEPNSKPPRLEPAVAERLATGSDAVAAALEGGDNCEADRRLVDLAAEIRRSEMPAAVRRQTLRVLARTEIKCVEVGPPSLPPPEEDEDEGKDKKHKKDKKHGHDDEGDDD